MTTEQRIHELKMAACNLRPKPFISCRGGRYCYSNGNTFYTSESLEQAVKTAIWDRTKNLSITQ